MRNPAFLALFVLVATLSFPALAPAAGVVHTPGGDRLGVTAAGGETNRLTVTLSGSTFTLHDDSAPVTALSPGSPLNDCTQGADANTVNCPAGTGITNLQATLADQGDTLTVDAPITVLAFGNEGDDTLTGGSAADELVGGDGDDTLSGRDGNDSLLGETVSEDTTTGRNTMDGGAGDDTIAGGAGPDTAQGGPDRDTLRGAAGEDDLDGGDGPDQVSGGGGGDAMRGGAGNDEVGLLDRRGPSLTSVELGNDSIDGGPGDDVLRPGFGAEGSTTDDDTLAGGSGRDQVTFEGRDEPVDASIDAVRDDGAVGRESDDIRLDVEVLIGGRSDDVLNGGPNADTIDGAAGSDRVSGGPGPDTLRGGAEDAGDDTLDGDEGTDTIEGAAGNDRIAGGVGNDAIDAGGDSDTVSAGADADTVVGGAGDDTLAGDAGNDTVAGGGPAVVGADGGDTLDGGEGNDALDGGDGNDTIEGGTGDDAMAGGPGTDVADYGVIAGDVNVTLDNSANDGPAGESDNVAPTVENVTGGGGDDTVAGSGEANALTGGQAEDALDGRAGADDLSGGDDPDILRSRDGATTDKVDCGRSRDFAILDRGEAARSCETVLSPVRAPRLAGSVRVDPVGNGNGFALAGMTRPTALLQDDLLIPLKRTGRAGRRSPVIDTTSRGVDLTAAKRRGRQTARFYGGASFTVAQGGSGVVDLTLTGGDFGACASARGVEGAGRRVRRLWGRGRGRYRTRGRHSVATVRGTTWLTEDRCDGTLTRVTRGSVTVRDLTRKRTVVVRAGKSYLAPARR